MKVNGQYYYLNKCQTHKHIGDDIFSFRKTAHWCTCIVCATHSNCCGNIDFLSPELRVKRIEEIKERLVEFWQCNDIAFEWKMQFLCFTILPGSAEVHVIWGGTVKHLLTAYFIGNISAKKISKCVHASKLRQTKGGTFFETQCISTEMQSDSN